MHGEQICDAYEEYREIFSTSQLSLERVMTLVVLLAEGGELALSHCASCDGTMLLDRLGVERRVCEHCRASARDSSQDGARPDERRERGDLDRLRAPVADPRQGSLF